jgi:hypothetical protein
MILKRLTITYSGLLLLGLLLEWWLFYFSALNIPWIITNTPIDTRGLLLIILLLIILLTFTKKMLRQDNSLSIINLTLAGTLFVLSQNLFFNSLS